MNILYQIFVSTKQLIKSATEAGEVYSTTDSQLLVFVSSRNCVQIRDLNLRGSFGAALFISRVRRLHHM